MHFIHPLEPRRLFAAAYPTALEQYSLELINRARANPTAEATRLGVDLNEGLAPGTISTAPKQPLAPNLQLTHAARTHSAWEISTDTFSHTGSGGTNPGQRMVNSGYVFTGSWNWAENIAYRSLHTASPTASLISALHADLFVDFGIPGRGHRLNILNPGMREIGNGIASGPFEDFTATMLTQDFAVSGSSVFLTGVAYNDAVTDDNFYTPGEGLGSVTISARRTSDNQTFSTTTHPAGGYSLPLPAGTYNVTASGGGLASPLTFSSVAISTQNVKRDFSPGSADIIRPTGTLTRAPRITSGGAKYYQFAVTYSDNVAMNVGSFDAYDTLITDPFGVRRYSAVLSVSSTLDGTPRTVTYMMKAPGGLFDAADNGVYTISLRKQQVTDTAGNLNAGKILGQFTVAITPTATSTPTTSPFSLPRKRPLSLLLYSGEGQGEGLLPLA